MRFVLAVSLPLTTVQRLHRHVDRVVVYDDETAFGGIYRRIAKRACSQHGLLPAARSKVDVGVLVLRIH